MSPSRPNTRAGLKSKSGSRDRKRGILFLVVQRKLEAGRKSSQHTSQSSLLTQKLWGWTPQADSPTRATGWRARRWF